MILLPLRCLALLASCTMSFPTKDTQETVIHSDSMEMTAQEGDRTVFQFSGNVQVTSNSFQATAHTLTALLSGNPIEETTSGKEAGPAPRLTQLRAEGDVYIHVYQEGEEDRTGSANQVDVDTVNDIFTLSENAQIHQKRKGNITGARIILDRRQNHLKVEGEAATDDATKLPQRPTIKLEPTALPSELHSKAHRDIPPANEDKHDLPSPSPVENTSAIPLIEAEKTKAMPVS